MASKSQKTTGAAKPQPNVATEGIGLVIETVGRPLIKIATTVIPVAIVYASRIYAVLQKLPQNALAFLYGTIICFFGGTFPTLFAAIKAAEHGGRKAVVDAVAALADEAIVIIDASKKDDTVDQDKDGKSDVDQISAQELLQRKALLVLQKMDPQKVNDALGAIYKVWLAVMAVLSIQFARTVSLSLTIASFLQIPTMRLIEPAAKLAVPKEYHKWVPVVLGWVCKWIALTLAWSIQTVISAAASALDGGIIMAHALYAFCVAHKMRLGGWIPDSHEDSYIDELFAYAFAGIGFYFQFKMGFDVPFPLSLVLWPFNMVEFYIRWSISK